MTEVTQQHNLIRLAYEYIGSSDYADVLELPMVNKLEKMHGMSASIANETGVSWPDWIRGTTKAITGAQPDAWRKHFSASSAPVVWQDEDSLLIASIKIFAARKIADGVFTFEEAMAYCGTFAEYKVAEGDPCPSCGEDWVPDFEGINECDLCGLDNPTFFDYYKSQYARGELTHLKALESKPKNVTKKKKQLRKATKKATKK